MGELAHFFHIRPWEYELLDYRDAISLFTQIDAIRAEANKGGNHG